MIGILRDRERAQTTAQYFEVAYLGAIGQHLATVATSVA